MYCNMPRLEFTAGSRVRIHLMSLGDIADMHTPSMGECRVEWVELSGVLVGEKSGVGGVE